jgi:hypothetical protein
MFRVYFCAFVDGDLSELGESSALKELNPWVLCSIFGSISLAAGSDVLTANERSVYVLQPSQLRVSNHRHYCLALRILCDDTAASMFREPWTECIWPAINNAIGGSLSNMMEVIVASHVGWCISENLKSRTASQFHVPCWCLKSKLSGLIITCIYITSTLFFDIVGQW